MQFIFLDNKRWNELQAKGMMGHEEDNMCL